VPPSAKSHLAIGITVYRPDLLLLKRLLSTAMQMTPTVLLHVDGPIGSAIHEDEFVFLKAEEARGGIWITRSNVNEGIAVALNRLASEASKRGCRSILYFDQDSDPSLDLADQLTMAMTALANNGQRPAVVGPRPIAGEPSSKPPHYRIRGAMDPITGCQPVDYVITSGSLFELGVFETLGLFREEYRIDAVDTEWCFRAWSRNRSVWMLPTALMPHQIGHGLVRFGPLAFPRQSEARMQTYICNQARMLRLGYVPLRWKLRTLFYVPLQAVIHAVLVSEKCFDAARRFCNAARMGWQAPIAALKTLRS
jgi:rhamnosyltransferase